MCVAVVSGIGSQISGEQQQSERERESASQLNCQKWSSKVSLMAALWGIREKAKVKGQRAIRVDTGETQRYPLSKERERAREPRKVFKSTIRSRA